MLDCDCLKGSMRQAPHMTVEGKRVGIVYNANTPRAKEVAQGVAARLPPGMTAWVWPTSEMEIQPECTYDIDAIVTVGGDGTILRVVRAVAPLGIPLAGVNLGRIGFMTEFEESEAYEGVPQLLAGSGWTEERAMLQTEILGPDADKSQLSPDVYQALNDVVVGRAVVSRLVRVRAYVDGALLATYRADALIMSTATGSTGYNLAAGGPILPPSSQDIIIKPVAPHLSLDTAVIVPGTSVVELTTESASRCMVSIDGQIDLELVPDAKVRLRRSPYVARFLRARPPIHYYATLIQRLGLVWGQEGYRPPQT